MLAQVYSNIVREFWHSWIGDVRVVPQVLLMVCLRAALGPATGKPRLAGLLVAFFKLFAYPQKYAKCLFLLAETVAAEQMAANIRDVLGMAQSRSWRVRKRWRFVYAVLLARPLPPSSLARSWDVVFRNI